MNENNGKPDPEQGLYRKYEVNRIDDKAEKHADCQYFVLDLDHDPHSVAALEAYAESCKAQYPTLAFDLRHTAAAAARKLGVSARPEALRSEMHRCLGFAFEMKGGVRTWPVWLCSMETVKEAVAKGWLSDSQLELLIPRMGMSQVVYRLTDEGGAEFMRHHYSVPSPLRQKP